MANIYVRSTDGNNADSGATWALAKATLAGAAAIDAAGDTIYISQVHAESTAGNVNITLAGTRASPTRVLCGNDAAEPPTALAATATLSVTGISTLNFSAANAYLYGLTLQAGSAGNNASLNLSTTANGRFVWDSCIFSLTTTNTSARINVTGADHAAIEWRNCSINFGNTGASVNFTTNGSTFRWIGGGAVLGSSSPNPATNAIFGGTGVGGMWLIENVDFSNFAAAVHIDNGGGSNTNTMILRNCKLPAAWSGTLVRTAITAPRRVSMYNCAAGATNYALWIEQLEGAIRDETTLVRTGGASDGVTPISYKMTSTANVAYPGGSLYSDEIVTRVNTTGSPMTLTVHILHDSVTNLTDDEVWVEVNYLGSSATPIATLITDAKADVLATAAAQAASSETWTTTGMANPNKQMLEVTFTPQMAGFVIARVALAKASKTIYYCPKAELS
jgi:hypothetical protein